MRTRNLPRRSGAAAQLLVFLLFALLASAAWAQETRVLEPRPQELYDLCRSVEPLTEGKILFLRYRHPLLDPILQTYELYTFDPRTRKITFLQKYEEKLYIAPVVARDRSTVLWHSLIEGNDFLMTSRIDERTNTRLRFDTGGYFEAIALDYDNDTIAAAIKRGLNKQGLYLISNRHSTIKRILNATDLSQIGFLENGNVCYVDTTEEGRTLGFVGEKQGSGMQIEEVEYVQKTPRGDGIFYSKGSTLYLFRLYGMDSVPVSRNFDKDHFLPLLSSDGTTAAVLERGSINIVNIPSGDILYLLSMETEGTNAILTNYTFYIAKGNKIFALKHKKPSQNLTEIYTHGENVRLLAASPDDRYLVFQGEDARRRADSPAGGSARSFGSRDLLVYDMVAGALIEKKFQHVVKETHYFSEGTAFYVVTRSVYPDLRIPVQELYYYDFQKGNIVIISAASNAEVERYLTKE